MTNKYCVGVKVLIHLFKKIFFASFFKLGLTGQSSSLNQSIECVRKPVYNFFLTRSNDDDYCVTKEKMRANSNLQQELKIVYCSIL